MISDCRSSVVNILGVTIEKISFFLSLIHIYTAHGSGEYAKTLKKHIPIICAEKPVLAKYIIQALECGLVPGREIGGSPAVLTVAKYLHKDIDFDNITDRAYEELASIGFTKEWMHSEFPLLTPEEIIARADLSLIHILCRM